MPVKLIIIGGVAGGATAAARARRLNESAEIILFERGKYISFANCGLPYYIGSVIRNRDNLFVTTPAALKERYNIDVRVESEVTRIDRNNKLIEVKNLKDGGIYKESYDKIILSPGAKPVRPPLDGIGHENIFTLRNIPDTDRVKEFIDKNRPGSAVIIGGGFIGLEMAENLIEHGIKITVIEMLGQVMAPLDLEMASIVQTHLEEKGVYCELNNGVKSFSDKGGHLIVETANGKTFDCDFVILSIGITPENRLAKDAGLETGSRGGIKVDSYMRTSDPDIYAVGDAVEINDFVTGLPVMVPLAGPANKQGRIAADNVFGRKSVYNGAMGTAIVKIFDITVAVTGANEKNLIKNNIPNLVSYTHSASHAAYYPGAGMMAIKLVFSPDDGKILGAQIIGNDGVDKRIDILATAIRGGMTVYDLEELELAYAPPYSSAKDPVNIAGNVASNIIKGDVKTLNCKEIDSLDKDNDILLDLRNNFEIDRLGAIDGAMNMPLNDLRGNLSGLDKNKNYILYCGVGLRAYIGSRILTLNGFKVKNLSGGYRTYSFYK